MFKRLFFAVLMVVTSISTGFLATAAQASTTPAPKVVRGIFDISRLDADDQLLVEEALACDDFDYAQMKPALKKFTGRSTIRVEVKDIGKYNAVGASWMSGALQIDDDVLDAHWFQQIFMHEVGHHVNYYFLGPQKLRGKIAKLYGAPWSTMGHDFNGGFTSAFSCFDAGDVNGYLDETEVQTLRTLMGGEGLVPVKTL